MEVRAARAIAAPSERIFDVLEDSERHVELFARRVERLAAAGSGVRLRVRAPGGLRRTVTVSLTYTDPREMIVARVEAGPTSRGTIRWSIQRSDVGSWVQVVAHADALGVLDAALLRLGGRRWVALLFTSALAELEDQVAPRSAAALTDEF
jgi:uncharacterized protein YndB with AHSA1/START domain